MRDCLFPALFVLAMTSALSAADDQGADMGDPVVAPVRPAAASSPVNPVPNYFDPTSPVPNYEAPAATQDQPAKAEKTDGPGYTQLGGQIILHLDREKTELTLYENSTYNISAKSEEMMLSTVPDRRLIEVEDTDPSAIAFHTLKPGVMWLTFYGIDDKRYVVEITIMGDTRTLTSQLKKLYPESNIQAIKVGQGVLLRGEVFKPEHVAEVVEIAEQYYPNALNQLKVKANAGVPTMGRIPVPVPAYQDPAVGSALTAPRVPRPTLSVSAHGGKFGVQPFVLEVDWEKLADAKVDLVRAIRSLESAPEEWAPQSTSLRLKAKQPATIRYTIPHRTAGNALQQLTALDGVEIVNLPAVMLSTQKPARAVVHKMVPVVSSRLAPNGRKILETGYQRGGTTLTLTTDRDSLEQANVEFQVDHRFQIDGEKLGADRDFSAGIGTHQLSGVVRLKSDQAVVVAETGASAATSNEQAAGKGLVVVIVPYQGPMPPAAAGLGSPTTIYQPAPFTPIEGPRGLRESVRELRGDVRALRKDVQRLLKLLEDKADGSSDEPMMGAAPHRKEKAKTELLVFTANWSGPCQKIETLLDEQGERGYSIRRIGLEKSLELAKKFHVNAVPTMIGLANGKEQERWVGIMGKNKLTEIVEKYAAKQGVDTWSELRESRTSAAERDVLKALKKEANIQLNGTPLQEAVREISETHHLNIVLDSRGLAEAGVSEKTPVSVVARGIRLESALSLILSPLQLAHQVRDEVLVITSKQRTQGELVVVTYPVADLVVPIPTIGTIPTKKLEDDERPDPTYGLPAQSPAFDFDTLIATIRSTVQPDSWSAAGGPASIQPFESNLSLVIRQTSKAHEEIADLISQLRRLQDMQVTLENRCLENVPDQLWEKIQGRLNAKDRNGIAEGIAVLTGDEAKLVLEAVQGDERPNVGRRPNITLFNGQRVGIAQPLADGQPRTYQFLQFQPVISADRRNVRLSVWVRDRVSPDHPESAEGSTRAFVRTVPDGKTLLIEVTEEDGKEVAVPVLEGVPAGASIFKKRGAKKQSGRRFLLVRPQIVVPEEEEELLGFPAKK